jgi:hypothetical protein
MVYLVWTGTVKRTNQHLQKVFRHKETATDYRDQILAVYQDKLEKAKKSSRKGGGQEKKVKHTAWVECWDLNEGQQLAPGIHPR